MTPLTGEPRLHAQLRLYVITDEREDATRLLPVIDAALRGGAGAVQLRRKAAGGRELLRLAGAIRELTARHGALFIVNDRVDVAWLADADGVHLGQEDIPCAQARRLLPGKIIGVSARTVEDARAAERAGADYLGVGAVYATGTKENACRIGLEGLGRIARAVGIPVVGIGGIGPGGAAAVREAGAVGVAVVAAVMAAPDPCAAARALSLEVGPRPGR